MGMILIIVGLLVMLLASFFWGIILIIIGLILLFWPHDNAYGYSRWRGRRRGPPAGY
jgi:fatty acid desaturase